MRIAIVGAGVTGLSCALECERLGVIADIFHNDIDIGWAWPSVTYWPRIFYRDKGDIINHLRETYGINIKHKAVCNKIIMKSPNHKVEASGDMGHFIVRGKRKESLESQIAFELVKTPIHYNRTADYKELTKKYDWVVVATGNDAVARELNVWEDKGLIRVFGGVALGTFNEFASNIYFNTEYAGTGYARVTPFNSVQSIAAVYDIGHGEFEMEKLFSKFLEYEGLEHLEFLFKLTVPPYTTGTVSRFRVGNVLLAGRAAGLTERLLGVGGPEDIISGVLAARAIIKGLDYDALIKPLKDGLENISSYRDIINKFDNADFDKLLTVLDVPGIKQLTYNVPINFVEMAGSVLKRINK